MRIQAAYSLPAIAALSFLLFHFYQVQLLLLDKPHLPQLNSSSQPPLHIYLVKEIGEKTRTHFW